MDIKSITCNNPIEAEGLRSALHEAGIESRIYDEANSKVARGILDARVEVLIKKEDYDKAIQIQQQLATKRENIIPWCPKCGSENITAQKKPRPNIHRIIEILLILCAQLIIGKVTTHTYTCHDCGHKWDR